MEISFCLRHGLCDTWTCLELKKNVNLLFAYCIYCSYLHLCITPICTLYTTHTPRKWTFYLKFDICSRQMYFFFQLDDSMATGNSVTFELLWSKVPDNLCDQITALPLPLFAFFFAFWALLFLEHSSHSVGEGAPSEWCQNPVSFRRCTEWVPGSLLPRRRSSQTKDQRVVSAVIPERAGRQRLRLTEHRVPGDTVPPSMKQRMPKKGLPLSHSDAMCRASCKALSGNVQQSGAYRHRGVSAKFRTTPAFLVLGSLSDKNIEMFSLAWLEKMLRNFLCNWYLLCLPLLSQCLSLLHAPLCPLTALPRPTLLRQFPVGAGRCWHSQSMESRPLQSRAIGRPPRPHPTSHRHRFTHKSHLAT